MPLQQIFDQKKHFNILSSFCLLSAVFLKKFFIRNCEDATDHPYLSVGDDRIFVKIKKSYAIGNRAKNVK